MSAKLIDIRDQVMSLSDKDRERLAFDLLDSLPDSVVSYQQEEVQEWGRRLSELKSGQTEGLSPERFFKEIRRT